MASAILRTIRPENYTVIDVRALESLGVIKTDGSVNDYLSYLWAGCELASKRNVSYELLTGPCGSGQRKMVAVSISHAPDLNACIAYFRFVGWNVEPHARQSMSSKLRRLTSDG
jgi:hypothetical protein